MQIVVGSQNPTQWSHPSHPGSLWSLAILCGPLWCFPGPCGPLRCLQSPPAHCILLLIASDNITLKIYDDDYYYYYDYDDDLCGISGIFVSFRIIVLLSFQWHTVSKMKARAPYWNGEENLTKLATFEDHGMVLEKAQNN